MARNIVRKILKPKFMSLYLERSTGYYTVVSIDYQTQDHRRNSSPRPNAYRRPWIVPHHTLLSFLSYRGEQFTIRPSWDAWKKHGFLPDAAPRVARERTRLVNEDSDI